VGFSTKRRTTTHKVRGTGENGVPVMTMSAEELHAVCMNINGAMSAIEDAMLFESKTVKAAKVMAAVALQKLPAVLARGTKLVYDMRNTKSKGNKIHILLLTTGPASRAQPPVGRVRPART
jgi:hypothetical protein